MPLKRPSRAVPAIALAAQIGYLSIFMLPATLSTQVQAQTLVENKLEFNIPQGNLTEALNSFAKTSGVFLSADSSLTLNKTSPGLQGTYSVNTALEALLKDTGLVFKWIDERTISILRQSMTTLEPVTITESPSKEFATGPVVGYIAKRSSSGTKTDTALIETAQAISVVSQDQITMQGAETPSQALRYTPGVVAELYGNDSRFDWVRIRGFSVNEYLDGMALPKGSYAWPRMELYGMNRAEVLRGPASVLYGSTPPGGLYNFVSKKPSSEAKSELKYQVGNPQRSQLSFDLTGPVSEDEALTFRLTGLTRDADTLVDYTENDRNFIQPSATLNISDKTALTLQGYYIEDDSKSIQFLPLDGVLNSNPNGPLPRNTFTGEPDYDKFDRQQDGISYHLEHEFANGWTLNHRLRKSNADILLRGVRPNFGWAGASQDVHNRAVFIFDEEVEALTSDTNILAKLEQGDVTHNVLAGIDYRRSEADYKAGFAAGTPLNLYNPTYGASTVTDPAFLVSTVQELDHIGVYLQDQIEFDQFKLMLSTRKDWAETDTRNRISSTTSSFSDSAFTYRVGGIYNFSNGFAPYAAYSTSFTPNLTVDQNGNAFDPTKGKQLEIGLKYLAPDERTQLTLSLFDLRQQDVVLSNPITSFNEQVGEVTVKGLEVEAKMQLQNDLNLIAGYSYTDAELTEHNTTSYIGNKVHTIPEQQASLWLDYKLPQHIAPGLRAGVGVRYVDSHFGDAANTIEIPSHLLTDLAVNYDLKSFAEGVKVSLNASNLFDKEYVATCDTSSCYWGEGRTVKGTISYTW